MTEPGTNDPALSLALDCAIAQDADQASLTELETFDVDAFSPWDELVEPEEEEEEEEDEDSGLIENVLVNLGLGNGNGNAYGLGNGNGNGNGNGLYKLLFGGDSDDTLSGTNEDDAVLAGRGHDHVTGGDGNDTLMGDESGSEGADATPLVLDINNLVSQTYTTNSAGVGDSAVYRDVAFLDDGTSVWGRVVLVGASDPNMQIHLSGERGAEILIDGYGYGDTAEFRLEFLIRPQVRRSR